MLKTAWRRSAHWCLISVAPWLSRDAIGSTGSHCPYAACGLTPGRERLRAAYGSATQAGYRAGAPIHGFSLKPLLEFLPGLQLDYLKRTRSLIAPTGGAGRRKALALGSISEQWRPRAPRRKF